GSEPAVPGFPIKPAAVPGGGAAVVDGAVLRVRHAIEDRPVPVRQAIVVALVGRQVVAVHLGEEAQVGREREVPGLEHALDAAGRRAVAEREPAPVEASAGAVGDEDLAMEARPCAAGRCGTVARVEGYDRVGQGTLARGDGSIAPELDARSGG